MDPTSYDAAPARLRAATSWLIGQLSLHAHRLSVEGFTAAGSHRYHYSLLAALAEFGPASQAALGRRIGIDRSDMVALVTDLAGRGLVERTPDGVDRRRNVITVTAAGLAHLERLDTVVAATQDELLAPLSTSERAQFTALLARLLAHQTRTGWIPDTDPDTRADSD